MPKGNENNLPDFMAAMQHEMEQMVAGMKEFAVPQAAFFMELRNQGLSSYEAAVFAGTYLGTLCAGMMKENDKEVE